MTIGELLTYRIAVVSNTMSRVAALRFRSSFDVSIAEWRTIGLLGENQPRSINELARAANLDIAQASRVAQELGVRGLVHREEPTERGRPVWLRLTPRGVELYRQLIEDADERHRLILASLTHAERRHLDRILGKLTLLAKTMLSEERQRVSPARPSSVHRDRG